MLESTYAILRCASCGSKLDLETLESTNEIDEGILTCVKCNMQFPIIEKIPIMWNDFSSYLSERKTLSGYFYKTIKNKKLKNYLKSLLSDIIFTKDDRHVVEERWSKIYQNSKNSRFYSEMKKHLNAVPKSEWVLEHGCSVGLLASYLSKKHRHVLGVDRSFSALKIAKKSSKDNLDFVLSDSLSGTLGQFHFNLVLGINVLELIEPSKFLKLVSKQISSGYLFISDPYDFERGSNSVKMPLNEKTLRTQIENLGFKISANTIESSFISWILKINSRTTLNYKVDLVIAKK